jgi:alkenylglycerophosphocholine hydrolase
MLVAVAVVAAADWIAVATGRRRAEMATKPLVILLLLGAAIALTPIDAGMRALFVAGLALSAVGDVALLAAPRWFSAGLAAFLLAHLAYIAGLLQVHGSSATLAAGLVFIGLAGIFVGIPIVRGAMERSGAALGLAVVAYLSVISATVVVAGLSHLTLARIGAVFLYASDGILGWNRFVVPIPQGRLLTRIAYHLGQALMVLSLVRLG